MTCTSCGAALDTPDRFCSQCGAPVGDVLDTRFELAAGGEVSLAGDFLGTSRFQGTKRYKLLSRLGSGAMGVVYSVRDVKRNETIALKTFLGAAPTAIYDLKKEFRALADVAHANLISLYELVAQDDQWFFTMELVHGVDFLSHVRRDGLDLERLRNTLRQLASGVAALHAAGKLHRDLKPWNEMQLGMTCPRFAKIPASEFRVLLEKIRLWLHSCISTNNPLVKNRANEVSKG